MKVRSVIIELFLAYKTDQRTERKRLKWTKYFLAVSFHCIRHKLHG
jgi:hypothetical protein